MTGARLAPRRGAEYASILGVGAYRPSRVVTNDEICEHIDSSDEWIRERSGIITRHFAAADESVVDMAAAASEKALAAAGISADQVDAVIVGTVTHLWQTPSAAAELAFRLGAGTPAAFDISAACAGFSYGLAIAQDLIRGGSATCVVVVGVEKLSDLTDPTDRSTAFIFGDGAGAAVVGASFDTVEENAAFRAKLSYPFPLLCDTERQLGLAYGACDTPSDVYARRLTFVVGPDGRLEHAIDTKQPGTHAAELLELLG